MLAEPEFFFFFSRSAKAAEETWHRSHNPAMRSPSAHFHLMAMWKFAAVVCTNLGD